MHRRESIARANWTKQWGKKQGQGNKKQGQGQGE
jgi:hypothetical protein